MRVESLLSFHRMLHLMVIPLSLSCSHETRRKEEWQLQQCSLDWTSLNTVDIAAISFLSSFPPGECRRKGKKGWKRRVMGSNFQVELTSSTASSPSFFLFLFLEREEKGKKDARRLDHEPGILCDLIHRLAFLLSSFSFKEKKEKGKERRILSTYPHMKGKKTTFIWRGAWGWSFSRSWPTGTTLDWNFTRGSHNCMRHLLESHACWWLLSYLPFSRSRGRGR